MEKHLFQKSIFYQTKGLEFDSFFDQEKMKLEDITGFINLQDSKNHIGSSKKVPRNELDTVDESPTDEADNKF